MCWMIFLEINKPNPMPLEFYPIELSKVWNSFPIYYKLNLIKLLFFFYSTSKIFDLNEDLLTKLFYSDMYVRGLAEFDGIADKIDYYLFESILILTDILI